MTSSKEYDEAFVWVWLPEETEPVVAGRLVHDGDNVLFNYGKSYLERISDKRPVMSIYEDELPLQEGILPLPDGLSMPGCIRDASPDAWGRRVIINKKFGEKESETDTAQLDELTYLLESGSDRVGAMDFQLSATEYEPRLSGNASLEELLESAERVERGVPLTPELDRALFHGTSIGGARPKALIVDQNKKYIAKFSSTSDIYAVVKAEYIAMRLANHVGINVAHVELTSVSNKDILLIERFDRTKVKNGWERKAMISALTILGLDDMMARYASYQDLAEKIRHQFVEPAKTLKELFARLVFNILCGNTDDHARNHAAFWDGENLELTPAYDICPQNRTGNEASQAMLISDNVNLSQIQNCINASHHFLLSAEEAREIYKQQVSIIESEWDNVCEEAELSMVDKRLLRRRQFLNPYALEGLE